ncbi:MAG: DNA cytosine methyltransferase [Nitrospinaceae bacterium]|nr:DNA cytosine methyltransferase [Nitrospinaceae bacterium]MBT3432510.1 DNA cytosine methyltransferase [Nitrospinaceae bacterium]MBT3821449.1 DNA cytosine methyltransferase [Nitrospinaceae bacterium]MBT4095198.1 DNA cytosine methyltransferase [Nitrospinaceae bacterium]MBT4429992.1 DNA cytosine methyltransferase [Nitrospinaceae bacterium]
MGRPIGIDLFAGAGGLSLGFEQAGFKIAAAVDIDPIHCAAHEYNFPNCKTICKDVAELTGEEIRKISGVKEKKIDVVFGGAPCQGFSLIGKRALNDPRNRLVNHFVRLVLELAPSYFLFENVKGLTIGKHRQFLEEIISTFEKNGYSVEGNYRVLNASNYGVPQKRERLFLFGCRKNLKIPIYPKKLSEISISDALADLPEVEKFTELLDRDWVETILGSPSKYAEKLREAEFASCNYGYSRKYNPNLLTSSARTTHTPLSRKRFAETPHGKTEPVSRFFKLDPQGVCNTLRAGTASDRGAFTSPRPIHPFTPRCITVREAARIHSYPDWFRFHVTKWHGFRQIGNSVPPLLAQAVAMEILRALEKKPSKPKKILRLGDSLLLNLSMSQAAYYYGVSPNVIPKRTRSARPKVICA